MKCNIKNTVSLCLHVFFLFLVPFLRCWTLVYLLFEAFLVTEQSRPTPALHPSSTIRGLWSSHCLSVLTQAVQRGDKLALPCASACVGVGVGPFVESMRVWGVGVLSLFLSPLPPQCVDTRIGSCPLGEQRANLWRWTGNRHQRIVSTGQLNNFIFNF